VRLAAETGASAPDGERQVVIAGERVTAGIWRGDPAEGALIAGPAVWQGPEATVLVPPGWSGSVDATGTVVLGRD